METIMLLMLLVVLVGGLVGAYNMFRAWGLPALFNQWTKARLTGVTFLAFLSFIAGSEFNVFYDISVVGTWITWFPRYGQTAVAGYLWLLSLCATSLLWNVSTGKKYYKVVFAVIVMAPMSTIFWMKYSTLLPLLAGSHWHFWKIACTPIVYGAVILLSLHALWGMTAPTNAAAHSPDAEGKTAAAEAGEYTAKTHAGERTDNISDGTTLQLRPLREVAGS